MSPTPFLFWALRKLASMKEKCDVCREPIHGGVALRHKETDKITLMCRDCAQDYKKRFPDKKAADDWSDLGVKFKPLVDVMNAMERWRRDLIGRRKATRKAPKPL
jgi:RNase P subunit RPR2